MSRWKFHGEAVTAETTCLIADHIKTSLSIAQWRAGNTPPLPGMEKPTNRNRAMTIMLWHSKNVEDGAVDMTVLNETAQVRSHESR